MSLFIIICTYIQQYEAVGFDLQRRFKYDLVFWMAAVSLPLAAVLILLINDHQQQYCELKGGKCQLLLYVCWIICCYSVGINKTACFQI